MIMTEKLTCSLVDAHARATLSRGLERGSTTTGATSRLSLRAWLTALKADGSATKTYLEFCLRGKEKLLLKYYQPSADGKLKFLFSERKKTANLSGAGRTRESSLPRPEDMGWRGELLTLNSCEWTGIKGLSLKDEGVCSLSDILEAGNVPQRYFLTRKACEGILRRSEKRGRELPAALRQALEESAAKNSSTLS
jgi:hypothetical protein